MKVPSILDALLVLLALGVSSAHVWLAPYTKVEESFTLQAVHDVLVHGFGSQARQAYDHVVFPGAVPRSFVPPILLAALAWPFTLMGRAAGLINSSEDVQIVVRLLLATCYSLSTLYLQHSLSSAPPNATLLERTRTARLRKSAWFLTILLFQANFWAGRTTPNSLAAPLVNLSLATLLVPSSNSNRKAAALALLGSVAAIARAELAGLFLILLVTSRISFTNLLAAGAASVVALLSSIGIDTFMWGRSWSLEKQRGLLWPELESIIFNVVEGKSAAWGVSPPHSYFTSHLPRLLTGLVPLVLLGSAYALFKPPRQQGSARGALMLSLAHVALLSGLGHKEARFVAYVVPLLTYVAALGFVNALAGVPPFELHSELLKRGYARLAPLGALASVLLTAVATIVALLASITNYPGGMALRSLHDVLGDRANVSLHIDTLSAMTGVSLFQSRHLSRPSSSAVPISPLTWTYDKREDLQPASAEWKQYTHLLSERKCAEIDGFRNVKGIEPALQFAGMKRQGVAEIKRAVVERRWREVLPVKLTWEPAVWVCERE